MCDDVDWKGRELPASKFYGHGNIFGGIWAVAAAGTCRCPRVFRVAQIYYSRLDGTTAINFPIFTSFIFFLTRSSSQQFLPVYCFPFSSPPTILSIPGLLLAHKTHKPLTAPIYQPTSTPIKR
ncbi:hypothetical protein E2C01_004407 [Portunus trituberculatus]|uniref:Uncharacterized protein n=1 Tax=Portunus trituberculatus TaxID=210409 RepID=A0A5B7CWA8_PORTR|nr:hypothetical protein [Portunus trituberculatus]